MEARSGITKNPNQLNWNEMYTMEGSSGNALSVMGFFPKMRRIADSDDLDESRAITAFGQLSLDENQEVVTSQYSYRKLTVSRSDTMGKQAGFIFCR